jgi:mono/diheme cytochrome c family protein
MKERPLAVALLAFAALAMAGVAIIIWLNVRGEAPIDDAAAVLPASPELVARGAYLALAGNCAACHTARGGLPYAGGRGIDTPFGIVYGGNLTPDETTGLGRWNADHFWRALHHGRSRDGRLLYPAFPYPEFTRVTRADSDALFAYLRSLPAVNAPNRAHELRFPYRTQAALALWRALFFRPATFEPEAGRSAEFNRGAYLVRGLAHCGACHGQRNPLGATRESLAFSGGQLPMQNWYAPSLSAASEAGVADWDPQQVVALLRDGVAPRASVLGPMAEVVFRSTQHLAEPDLRAIAVFLASLPPAVPPPVRGRAPDAAQMQRGAQVYEAQCADCHGAQGQGAAGAYPALAGNRAVTMVPATNAIRVVISGGFPPATAGNPRPYGMPPLGQDLTDADIAAVLSFVRNRWGNQAPAIAPHEVTALR